VTEKCLHDVDVDPCPAISGGRAVPASRPGGLSIPRANGRGRTSWRTGTVPQDPGPQFTEVPHVAHVPHPPK